MLALRPISLLNKLLAQVAVLTMFFFLLVAGLLQNTASRFQLDGKHIPKDADVASLDYEARLVVASQKKDDTTWLRGSLEAWEKGMYVVDNADIDLTVPVNKEKDAMVYLTYVSFFVRESH